MEDFVFKVPVEVLHHQILPFLSLKELVSLDTATCHKKIRLCFHERIQGATHLGNLTSKLDSSVLKWLSTRKMSLENIFLNEKTSDDAFVRYGAALLKTKRCILGTPPNSRFNSAARATVTHKGFASIVDHCTNLEYLDLSKCQKLKSGESIAYLHNEKRHHPLSSHLGIYFPMTFSCCSAISKHLNPIC